MSTHVFQLSLSASAVTITFCSRFRCADANNTIPGENDETRTSFPLSDRPVLAVAACDDSAWHIEKYVDDGLVKIVATWWRRILQYLRLMSQGVIGCGRSWNGAKVWRFERDDCVSLSGDVILTHSPLTLQRCRHADGWPRARGHQPRSLPTCTRACTE